MPSGITRSPVAVSAALVRERRKNKRLRTIIETLQRDIRENCHTLNVQIVRVGQLQAELDRLKAKTQLALISR